MESEAGVDTASVNASLRPWRGTGDPPLAEACGVASSNRLTVLFGIRGETITAAGVSYCEYA